MARSRNIKPGFFRNADLAELPVEARLLFIGLWTIADREGRLKDRPKQIKMEIFPADNYDCNDLIQQIADAGMLVRYEHGGAKYLQITNFTKHQNPHKDEQASTIPAQGTPDATQVKEPAEPPIPAQTHHVKLANAEDAPCIHDACMVHAPCIHDACTEVARLNPESLLLNPESLIPEEGAVRKRTARTTQKPPQRPDSISESVWQDFQAIRKAKRAPLTDTALVGMEREATKAGLSLEAAIRFCCEAGWQAFNAGWYAERQAKLPQKIVPLPAANLNRQEALEARNRAVAAEWVADMEAQARSMA